MVSKLQNTKKNFKKLLVFTENIFKQLENTTNTPLFHSNRFISDFKHKAELFFLNQCSLISNNSKLPTNLNHVTDTRLTSATFSVVDIPKVFQNLN